jgi:hypothetical protein
MFDLLFLNAYFESEFPIFNLELLLVGAFRFEFII